MRSNNQNQDYTKISKVGQQTKRQIDYVDKLLRDAQSNSKTNGIKSINPNPILGTEREKELKINQLLGVENEIQKLAFQANTQGIQKGFSAILNQDMIQQLNEQSMDQLYQKQNGGQTNLAPNQNSASGQAQINSGYISAVTQHQVQSPASGEKQQKSGFSKNNQHIQSGYGHQQSKAIGSPLVQNESSFANNEKTQSNHYLYVTPGQNKDLAGKDMAPFMVNQKTNVTSDMQGLISNRNIGKRSLQEMSTANDVHRPAEPMSGTITNNRVDLQMNGGHQQMGDNRNSNRGFGPFSKVRTNSLEEPDSKSSNDVTSDHLPGILPPNQVYGFDSKGVLGFTLLSPSNTPITQQIHHKFQSKGQKGVESNALQGLFGESMGSKDKMNPVSNQNREVDLILNQVRQRKAPKKGLNNILYGQKDQLSHLNPIKVTKIYAKHQNTDAARNVYNKLFNDIQPKDQLKDNSQSPSFPVDNLQDGLNKFKSLQKMANMEASHQFSNLMPKASNAQIRVFGDQFNTVQNNAQYLNNNGAYISVTDPLKLEDVQNNTETVIRGTSKKIYRRKEYSQIYERNHDDDTPQFQAQEMIVGGTQTVGDNKLFQPIIRRNYTREGTGNELPKIKSVSIAPRLEFDNHLLNEKRHGLVTQVNQRDKKMSHRWKTPINTIDHMQGSTQFSFNTSNEFPTGRRILDHNEKMNRTQDFVVFKQGFSASKFPMQYKANDITNSIDLSSKKNSPRYVGNNNSAQFKFTLDSKRNSSNPGQTSVSIGMGSRIKLFEQIQNMKNQASKNDQKSSFGATQTDEITAAATERVVTFAHKVLQNNIAQPQNTQDPITNSEITRSEAGALPTNRTTNTNQRHRLVQELQDMIGEANGKENENGEFVELNDSARNKVVEEDSFEYLQKAMIENVGQNQVDTQQHSALTNVASLNAQTQPQVSNIQSKKQSYILNSGQKNLNQQLQKLKMQGQIMSAEMITQPGKTSPKQSELSSSNFYRDIESLPAIPVLIELKVQDQLRALQKKIRQSKDKIKDKFLQNEAQREKMQGNLNQREHLLRTLQKYEVQENKKKISEIASQGSNVMKTAQTPSTPQGFNHRQMTPQGYNNSQGYDQSQKSNVEDPASPNIYASPNEEHERSTQLHNNSTAQVDQMTSFQGVTRQIFGSNMMVNQEDNVVQGKTSGGLPSQPLQSLGNFNGISLNQSQDNLQGGGQNVENDRIQFTMETPETTINTAGQGSIETPNNRMQLAQGQQNVEETAYLSHTPKFDQSRSLQKLAIKKQVDKNKKNLEIERQILSLYKYKFTNDFNREKAQLDNQTDLLKGQVGQEQEEIKRLRQDNALMLKSCRRYAQYIENFKQEKDKFTTYLQNQGTRKVMNKIQNNLEKKMRKHKTLGIDSSQFKPQQEGAQISINEAREYTLAIDEQSPLQPQGKQPPKIKTNTNSPTMQQNQQNSLDPSQKKSLSKESSQIDVDIDIVEQDHLQENNINRTRNFQETFTSVSKSLAQNVVNPQERGILNNSQERGILINKSQSKRKHGEKSADIDSSVNTIPTMLSQSQLEKLDMGKVVKFGFQIQQQCKVSDKPLDFALILLDIVKQFTGCSKAMIIPIDYYLGNLMTSRQYNAREKMTYIHSIEFTDSKSGEQRKLAVVARSESDVSKTLALDSITDDNLPSLVVKNNMLAILFKQEKSGGGPSFILQVENEEQVQENRGSKSSRKTLAGSKKNTTKMTVQKSVESSSVKDNFMRRAGIEGLIIQVVFRSVQLKFECIQFSKQIQNFGAQKDTTLKMISECTRTSTLRGLMRTMYNVYKAYTGFEEMSVMFHDKEKNALYAITFGDDEEHYQDVEKALKRAQSQKEKESILVKESVRDVILSQNQMIQYPIHMGITSKVFKSQKSYMMNNFKASSNFDFMNEIDNPKGIKQIRNVMIGALKREDGSSNGIIQLYNSRNPISVHERKKFEAVSKFFGGMIEKVEDKTKKLTTVVAVQIAKDTPNVATDEAMAAIDDDGTINSYMNIIKPFSVMYPLVGGYNEKVLDATKDYVDSELEA